MALSNGSAANPQCLEAPYERGVPGVYFLLSACRDPTDPFLEDQQFMPVPANRSRMRGKAPMAAVLLQSARLPGFCMQGDPFQLPHLPVHPSGVISHGFGDMNIAFHFAHRLRPRIRVRIKL